MNCNYQINKVKPGCLLKLLKNISAAPNSANIQLEETIAEHNTKIIQKNSYVLVLDIISRTISTTYNIHSLLILFDNKEYIINVAISHDVLIISETT